MKKGLLIVAALAASFAVKALPWTNPLVAEAEKTDITGMTMTIDGVGDEAIWAVATSYNIDSICDSNPSTIGGTFKVAWDETYLYFLVNVEDDVILNHSDLNAGGNWHQGDCVEAYILMDTADQVSDLGGTKNYSQFRFLTGETGDTISGGRWITDSLGNSVSTANYQYATGSIEEGVSYVLEAKVAWNVLGKYVRTKVATQPKVDQYYVFEVQVNDNDVDNSAAKISWSWASNASWRLLYEGEKGPGGLLLKDSKLSTGNNPIVNNIKVTVSNGLVQLSERTEVKVFGIDGKSVFAGNTNSFKLNPGAYVLNLGSENRKLIVK